MPSTWVKVLLRATPVTIPGRAIGRIDQEGDRLAAEEAVARRRRARRGVPSSERDRGRRDAGLDRGEQRFAGRCRFRRPCGNQSSGQAGRRPFEDLARVEGVDHDHDQRDVDEGEADADGDPQQQRCARRESLIA